MDGSAGTDIVISILAPSRERLSFSLSPYLFLIFQSTLPHGSDIHTANQKAAGLPISIHAPSRERHKISKSMRTARPISIHAPSRERRLSMVIIFIVIQYFNPRSLTGATCFAHFLAYFMRISIHAPSRERRTRMYLMPTLPPFQSTLPHGSDSSARR